MNCPQFLYHGNVKGGISVSLITNSSSLLESLVQLCTERIFSLSYQVFVGILVFLDIYKLNIFSISNSKCYIRKTWNYSHRLNPHSHISFQKYNLWQDTWSFLTSSKNVEILISTSSGSCESIITDKSQLRWFTKFCSDFCWSFHLFSTSQT